ncbi:putative mitochondrial protein [Vitis vinifera]|uniref:Putative mitochondrial protein n=1 Tax=Vitis vinifera TaxID=29760 RepID=A0A438KPM5_VITVI|nr:putative mitochondrial protein [Vitis vinifera]
MGFGEKRVGWMRWWISFVLFLVLVNGIPLGFFHNTKGLRQGDPLLPYLFVIGMEALSCLINRAVSEGFLSSYRVRGRGGDGVQVTHLLFVDDTLVFCEASPEQMVFLSWAENVEDLALELGCKVGVLPSSYLGLSLGAARKLVVVWDGVEERFWKRLAVWKRHFVSKGRRVILLVHFVKYADILHVFVAYATSDKKKGDLGVRCLSKLYRAFLGKWSWRFVQEGEILWNQVISKKYEVEERGGVPEKSFNDWELEAVASLLSVLQGKRLNVGMEDRVVWNASKNGSFSVKSLYNTLDSGGAVSFPWRIIWSPCVPTKVGFFAWEASWGKVLTQDHLKRRGWSLANRCFLCCDDEETINHILIHCPKAKIRSVGRFGGQPPFVYFGRCGKQEIG